MMDQLTMCMKAHYVASNKNGVKKELYKTKNVGLAAYRKFKITIKCVPTALPVNSNPSQNVLAIDIKT